MKGGGLCLFGGEEWGAVWVEYLDSFIGVNCFASIDFSCEGTSS